MTTRARLVVGLGLGLGLAGCPSPKPRPHSQLSDPVASSERDLRFDLVAELQDDLLKSYDRDEPPDPQTAMLLPNVGPARIGVRPTDALLGAELAHAPSRWPLDIAPPVSATPASKRMQIHLAADHSAAWVDDEISWRIEVCGLTAAIPLRMTALYARDGDRWVLVFEHLAFPHPPSVTPAKARPRAIASAVATRDLADELSRVLAPLLSRGSAKAPPAIATGADAAVLGVDVTSEWRGADVAAARLVPGAPVLRAEGRRVGVVGGLGRATVAYWVGNFEAQLAARAGAPAGRAWLRGSFVFERRDARWVIVQAHVSQAIDDVALAHAVFGSALATARPLQLACDATAPTAPAAGPSSRAPAAGTR